MALLTDFQTLAMLTSVGTLFVTGMVSAALLFHRYHQQGEGDAWPALARLLCVVASSFGEPGCNLSSHQVPPGKRVVHSR